MPFPFDATLKELVQSHPADFQSLLGLEGHGQAVAINVDLSTISAASDVVLACGEPPTALFDLNFQASRDDSLAARLMLYNALLYHRHRTPVHTTLILLRESADGPELTGKIRYRVQQRARVNFTYEVIRLWKQPVRRLMKAGPGALPLALLARLPKNRPRRESLESVIQQVERRLLNETAPGEAAKLLTAAFVLSGLRVSREQAVELFKGVFAVEESTTYQYILEKGGLKEAKRMILRMGVIRFGGPPGEAIKAQLEAIDDLELLERLGEQLLTVNSWEELLPES